jgi:hypothetical protein
MATVGPSRAGSTILPTGTYSTELSDMGRKLNAAAAAMGGVFSALQAGIAAAQRQVESFVAKADPAAVIKFKLAIDDLHGVIGRMMVPLLNNLGTTFRKVADHLYALSPAAKALIAGLTAAAVGFVVVTTAIWGMNVAFATLTGGLSAVLGAIGAGIAGILMATSSTGALEGALDTLMGPMGQFIDALGQVATALAVAVAPLMETVFAALAAVMKEVATAIQQAMPMFLRLAAWFRAVAEFVAQIVGLKLGGEAGPPKAPNAVRQAQMGGIQDFISRQYVSALQGGSPQQKQLDVMKGMADDVKEILRIIEKYVTTPGQIRSAANVVAGAGAMAVGFVANHAKEVTQYMSVWNMLRAATGK